MGLFGRHGPKNEAQIVDDKNVLLSALLNSDPIGKHEALSLPAVAEAVDKISNTIAALPVKLYKDDGEKAEEIFGDVRTKLLNDETGDTLDAYQFKRALIEDYLLGKGGFAYINRAGNKIKSLHYVSEEKVSCFTNEDPVFKKCSYSINGKTYDDYQIFKILRNTRNGVEGNSIIDEIAKAIETAYREMLYQLNMVKTGGNKKGFLTSENKLSNDAIATLRDSWRKLYSSSTENIVVLNKGIKFQESSNSNVELQLNESKTKLNEEINGIFHISDDNAEFYKYAIMPIIAQFESALNKYLLLEKEKPSYYFAFDIGDLTKGSILERYQAYQIALANGWLSRNEVRYSENLDKIEGLDTYNVSLGTVLYNPETKTYFTPNTQTISSGSEGEGTFEEGGEGNA